MKKSILISFFLIALILSACDTEKNYKLLSFFFDGVPNPTVKVHVSNTVKLDSAKIRKHELILKKAQPNFVLHNPFKTRKCVKCHNISKGFSLVKSLPQLCYSCHKDFVKKPLFIHGPVESGYCTKCHHPHKSKNKYMLLKTGQALCLQCHTRRDVFKKKLHNGINNTSCVSCHNPHGGKVKYFLLKQ